MSCWQKRVSYAWPDFLQFDGVHVNRVDATLPTAQMLTSGSSRTIADYVHRDCVGNISVSMNKELLEVQYLGS
jgi:hypothetical protein